MGDHAHGEAGVEAGERLGGQVPVQRDHEASPPSHHVSEARPAGGQGALDGGANVVRGDAPGPQEVVDHPLVPDEPSVVRARRIDGGAGPAPVHGEVGGHRDPGLDEGHEDAERSQLDSSASAGTRDGY